METSHFASLTTTYSSDNPDTTCKRYTQLLHEYNDIKDVGQGLMGLLAEARGARQIEVEKEFGVSDEI
ncbi:DNA repair protein Swi5 [Penicillium vulpinum]|uniref:DNA repair protein Swi5 n=1 Tax=Penicillium vulpinum TaxID=29845 RepID=UPI002548ACEB|nr:DNA repair protein Swi5 [Penicillium vulpinum]KAJ5963258.1 DNA repair protein Swi5 [Penicillium vulpinum]